MSRILSIVTLAMGVAAATLRALNPPVDPLFSGVREPLPAGLGEPQPVESRVSTGAEPYSAPVVIKASSRPVKSLPFPIEAILEPDREGVVVMQYGERSDPPAIENLFDYRVSSKPGLELQILVSSVSVGVRPLAVVNGRLTFLGQRVEGFNLVHVEREAIFMEKNGRIVRFPIGRTVRIEEAIK